MKDGHDENVKEILKRLEKNNLYVKCYDLAKRLSHYLYFFFFSFLIGLTTTRWSVGKYHVILSQCHKWCDGWSHHSVSHD